MKSPLSTDAPPTPLADIATYNNFYEFGTDKGDPARNAGKLTTHPWTVRVDGLVAKPADYQLEDILKPVTLEERVYRLRCVEAWSMVVPWVGFPLADLLKRVEPLGSARTSRSRPWCGRTRCRASAACSSRWTGPTSRACAWTRPCTR